MTTVNTVSDSAVGGQPTNGYRHEVEEVLVDKLETVADGVRRITLRLPDGSDFPQWEPGSHID